MGSSRDRLNGGPELTGSLCIQTSRQQRRANTAENIARTRLRRPGRSSARRPAQAHHWAPQPAGLHLSAAPWRPVCSAPTVTARTGSSSTQLRSRSSRRASSPACGVSSRLPEQASADSRAHRRRRPPASLCSATRWSTSAPSVRSPQPEPNRWAWTCPGENTTFGSCAEMVAAGRSAPR